MKTLPTFETKRLILRGVTESDVPSWQKHFDDYEVIRNLSAVVPWPYPKDGALTFLKNMILPQQGIMTEAVEPVMDYAFDKLGFDVLIFTNARGNIGSRRVKEKTGARLIRVEPNQFVDPKFTEHEVWELRKEDWKARK
jgi:RimJ/RimL family protein N-acetyltransferase